MIYAQWNSEGYGLLLKIREDGTGPMYVEHWIAHLSKFYVTGGHVNKGDLIALSGETGNGPAHVHYHVQTWDGKPIDVRGMFDDVDWLDETDYCYSTDPNSIDGNVHPASIASGTPDETDLSVDNCPHFYSIGFQGVFVFDAPNCQGIFIFAGLQPGEYDLAAMGVNDRLRSISTRPGLHFWLYGNSGSDSLAHCHENDNV